MRTPLFIALLLLAGCSWDPVVANILVQVDGVPQSADHLDVTLTSSDSSVQPKMFRPSFQPVDPTAPLGSVHLAFTAPSQTGTFTVAIVAADRACPSPCTSGLASGTVSGTEPSAGAVANLQVTLH
jgi:hypothetical protein